MCSKLKVYFKNKFQDDVVVPFILGERLYQVAVAKRAPDAKPVKFVPFEEDRAFGHVLIYSAPEFPEILK